MKKLKSALSFILAASLLVSSDVPALAESAVTEAVSEESTAQQGTDQSDVEDLGQSQDTIEAQAVETETPQTETPGDAAATPSNNEEAAKSESTESKKTDETFQDNASTAGSSESSTAASTISSTEATTEVSIESSAESSTAATTETPTDSGITEEQLDTEIAAANEKIQTVDESVDVIGKPVSGGKAIDGADTFAVSLQTHISDGSFTGTGLTEQAPSITGYEFAGTVSINGTAVDRIYKELEEQTEEKTFLVKTSDGTEQTEDSDGTLEPLTKEVKKTVVTSRTIVTKASNADEIITLTKQESGDVTAEFSYKKLPEEKTYAVKAHAVDEDGKTIDGHDADTLEVKDALDLTEDPIGIEGYTYKEADATIDGNDLVLASLTSEDGSYTGYTYYTDSDKKDETTSAKIKADLTITLVYEKKETEKKAYKLTLETVDQDGKAIEGYENKTLPAGDTVDLTEEPFAVEGYVYDEAEIDDAVVTSINSEDGIYTSYTVKTDDPDASKVEIKSDLTIKLVYEEEKKQVKLAASLVDMSGEPIKGYEDAKFPKFGKDGVLTMDDADNAPYDHVGRKISKTKLYKYDYKYATISVDGRNLKVKALKKENVKNGKKTVSVYSYTTDGSIWNEITEDTTVKFVFTAGTKFFYEASSADGSITVYANLNESDAIPDDAELVVTPVYSTTAGYNYDAYLGALNDTASDEGDYSEDNTYLFDVAFYTYALDENGQETDQVIEVQPAEGSVRFTVRFNDNQISDGLDVDDAEDVSIKHLPLESSVRNSVDSTKDATDISDADIIVENVSADVSIGNSESASFTLDSMSMLAAVRGPRRVAPAPTSELSAYMDSATLNGATVKDGKYQVYEGQDYTFSLHFKETPEGQQFPNDGIMTYTLPDGINVSDITTEQYIDIKGSDSQGSYTARGKYTIEGGVIKFQWSQDSEDDKKAFPRLINGRNAEFSLNIGASFKADTTKVEWKTGVVTDVNVNTNGNVTSSKSISYGNKNEVHYKLVVTSEGYNPNTKVTDTLKSDFLYYSGSAVSISSSDSTHTFTPVTPSTSDKQFIQELGALKNGETVTIEYTCKIDHSKITLDDDGNLKIDKAANTVSSKSDKSGEDAHGGNDDYTIDMNPSISKTGSSTSIEDGGEKDLDGKVDGYVTVPWTIVYNADGIVSMDGKTVTDTIGSTSFQRMKYDGDVTVRRYKGSISVNNGIVQSTSDWKEIQPVGEEETFPTDSTKQSWSYSIQDKEPYSYVITYHTKVDVRDKNANFQVDNEVTDGHSNGSAGGEVGPGEGNQAGLAKTATEVTDKYIKWQISLKVPTNGLNEAVITDTFPNRDNQYYDYLSSDAITVDGLDTQSGESYSVDKAKDNHSVNITFYRDSAKTIAGLHGGTAERTVTVTVKTVVDQNWLAFAKDHSYAQTHTNTAELNHDSNLRVHADAVPSQKEIVKTADASKNRTVAAQDNNNIELPAYYFHVVLTGVSVDKDYNFTFTDVYPSSLTFCNITYNDAKKVKGGDQYFQGNDYGEITNVTEVTNSTTNETTATITVHLNGNPSKYTNYGIGYYLQVKDADTFSNLGGQAKNAPITLTNIAKYGSSQSSANVTFAADPVKKEATDAVQGADGYSYSNYTITLNPTGATLNCGNPLTLTDTFTNQSVDYLGLTITTVPANAQVTYDFSGNKGTFTIPDSTKVTIKYRARINGTGKGTENGTESVTYTNTADFAGYHAETSKTADIHTSGSGTVSNLYIKLLKYESGNMTNGLSGAQFDLYNASDMTKPLKRFTTGDDGTVTIEGTSDDQFTLIEGRKYVLKEVVAPTGYELDPTEYEFTIQKQADYSKCYYVNGDTLKVSDQKKKGSIAITKEISNSTNNDSNREFQFKVTVYDSTFSGEHGDGVKFTVNETNGESVGYVTVKTGNTVTVKGIPVGTQYKVEEVLTDEQKLMYQSTISSNAQGIIELDNNGNPKKVSVTATNNHLRGKLEISKQIFINGAVKTTDEKFPITITLKDADKRAVSGDFKAEIPAGSKAQTVTVADGKLNLNIKSGETILLTNLPAGATYTVSETDTGTYTEDTDNERGKTGTISTTTTASAKLINKKEIKTGKLTIRKMVSPESAANDQEFTFDIKLTGTADSPITSETNKTYSGTEFTYNGADSSLHTTVTLKHGETITIAELPEGWTYEVNEQKENGFVTTYGTTGNTGSIVSLDSLPEGKRVDCTNTKVSGLVITKYVKGTSGDKTHEFHFTITLKGVDAGDVPNNTDPEFTYDKNSGTATATFTLKDSDTKQITGLKAGTKFTVTEDKSKDSAAAAYETKYEYSGTTNADNDYVIGGDANTLTVTNTKNMYGGLVVNKVVTGNDPDKKSWFAVKISLSDNTITGQYGEVYFVKGESYGRTSAGSVADYDYEGGAYYDSVYKGRVNAGYVVVRPQEGTTKVQNADPIVIWGLPEGVTYTVTEDDYSVTYDKTSYEGNGRTVRGIVNGTFDPGVTEVPSDAQTQAQKAGNLVTVTNERKRYGKLRVEKHVLDKDGQKVTDASQKFNFRITLRNADDSLVTGSFNDGAVTFNKGIANVTVSAGSYLEITGLPLRAKFTVEELDENGNSLTENTGITGYEAPKYELWYAGPESGSKQERRSAASSGTIDVKERTVKVYNRQTTISVKAQKRWNQGDGTVLTGPSGASVVFTLYKNGTSTGKTITLDGKTDSNGETEAWVADFGELPKYSYTSSGVSENSYTVRETTTYPGYIPTSNEVAVDGTNVNFIVNKITSVKFRKIDGAGRALSGAQLQIKNGNEVVAEWTTDGSDHEVKGLSAGVSYTLHESSAPEGYRLAEDTVFELNADGTIDAAHTTATVTKQDSVEILTVTDQKQVQVLKVDDAGNPLSGATFELVDKNKNTVVESWTSGEDAHVIAAMLPAGTYALKETSAPSGYSKISADLTVDANGDWASGDANVTISTDENKPYLITAKDTYTSSGRVIISGTKTLTTTKGTEKVNGRKLKAGDFEFGLFESDGKGGEKAVLDAEGHSITATNNVDGTFSFPEINYTKADVNHVENDGTRTGTKNYIVKEIIPEGATPNDDGKYVASGVTYDNTEYSVTVTLTDDGQGTIKAVPTIKRGNDVVESIGFSNNYESNGSTTITAKKMLTGRTGTPLKADEFKFKLTSGDKKYDATNDTFGNVAFKDADGNNPFVYTQDDITDWNTDGTGTGSKTYTLQEVIPASEADKVDGITYDETTYTVTVNLKDNGDGSITATPVYKKNGGGQVSEAVFNNIYTAKGDLVLQGSKTLNNKQIGANEFRFGIYENGELIEEATNDASGTFIFTQLHYENTTGTRTYTIKEIIPDGVTPNADGKYIANGVTYDNTEYSVTVTLTDDKKGHIIATPSYKKGNETVTSISFSNDYKSNGFTTIAVRKAMTGKKPGEGEFNFTLTSGDKKYGASNDASGSIVFKNTDGSNPFTYTQDDITNWTANADGTFTGSGTKTYKISEDKGSDNKVTYDRTTYTVTVNLIDNGNGSISATPVITKDGGGQVSEAVFNNSYAASGSLVLHGNKELSGRTLKAGEFIFELLDEDGKPVIGADGTAITATNGADGNFAFEQLNYSYDDYLEKADHKYTYKIREKNTKKAGISYDSDVETVNVTLVLHKLNK